MEHAKAAVLVKSEPLGDNFTKVVQGYEFNHFTRADGTHDFQGLLDSYSSTGFQATSFGQAVEEVEKMLSWRLSDEPLTEEEKLEDHDDPEWRSKVKCKIFLGYTSNLISSGVRESIRFLAEHKLIDCVVTTAGGVEEDFIKCLAQTYVGDFHLKGSELRMKGINRIGNLLVPNDNYCKFEDWLMPILDAMVDEQQEMMKHGETWTPSKIIARLGKEINHPGSVYYWCYKNNIPVYCPALTDGSLGDMIYFHSSTSNTKRMNYLFPNLLVDIAPDLKSINNQTVFAKKTGMIILGGGVVKHHICNANLMRNGADYAVFINTGQEFDGSDSGARPDEAVSWGKIRMNARPVKVYADATLVFPLLVAQTFAKFVGRR